MTSSKDRLRLAGFQPKADVTNRGEVLNTTAQRLIRYGCTEPQAYTLARIVELDQDASDVTVEAAVCLALVAAKQAVSEPVEVELIAGRRCDVQRRLEGRQ